MSQRPKVQSLGQTNVYKLQLYAKQSNTDTNQLIDRNQLNNKTGPFSYVPQHAIVQDRPQSSLYSHIFQIIQKYKPNSTCFANLITVHQVIATFLEIKMKQTICLLVEYYRDDTELAC